MSDPQGPRPPPPDSDPQQRRRQREELIRLADATAARQAYARHRDQILLDQGAPATPDRGPAGCLALLVVPLGLLLLTVHPLPGMLVLSLGAALYLIGSYHLDRSRARLAEAETEARRRWSGSEAKGGGSRPG